MNTIQDNWQSYFREVLLRSTSERIPEDDIRKHKRDFYSGALTMLQLHAATAQMTDMAAVFYIKSLADELNTFFRPETQEESRGRIIVS